MRLIFLHTKDAIQIISFIAFHVVHKVVHNKFPVTRTLEGDSKLQNILCY